MTSINFRLRRYLVITHNFYVSAKYNPYNRSRSHNIIQFSSYGTSQLSQGHIEEKPQKQFKLLQEQNNSRVILTKTNFKYFAWRKNSTMSSSTSNTIFDGELDRFQGFTVWSETEYDKSPNFPQKLKDSLTHWQNNKIRCVWFRVKSHHSNWIPELIKEKFDFHNAHPGMAVLVRWLSPNEPNKIPSFAHTMIGAGGLVINDMNEVLVVSETRAAVKGSWKLPGGYVDPGENIVDAAIREVQEETNVKCEFKSLVTIRHTHHHNFNTSDLYFVVALKPVSFETKGDGDEIEKIAWMPVDEYLNHPKVHNVNKFIMNNYLNTSKKSLRITKSDGIHQVTKLPVQVFHIHAPES